MIVSAHIETPAKDMAIEKITVTMIEKKEEATEEENVIPVASVTFSVVVVTNKTTKDYHKVIVLFKISIKMLLCIIIKHIKVT